jgi:hypothetical protein
MLYKIDIMDTVDDRFVQRLALYQRSRNGGKGIINAECLECNTSRHEKSVRKEPVHGERTSICKQTPPGIQHVFGGLGVQSELEDGNHMLLYATKSPRKFINGTRFWRFTTGIVYAGRDTVEANSKDGARHFKGSRNTVKLNSILDV